MEDPQSNIFKLLADDAMPALGLVVGALIAWFAGRKTNRATAKKDAVSTSIAALQAALERLTTELGDLQRKVDELEAEVGTLGRAHRSAIGYVQRLLAALRGAGIRAPTPPDSVREHLDETDLEPPAGTLGLA